MKIKVKLKRGLNMIQQESKGVKKQRWNYINKSNSTADDVQVEAKLQEVLRVHLNIKNLNVAKRRSEHYCASSHRLRDGNISRVLYLKIRSRSRSAIFAITHLIANVKIYRCFPHIVVLTLTVSEIYKF